MTDPTPNHVFISYSTRDSHFVARLRSDLDRAGVRYWIDQEGLQPNTRNWERAIRAALRENCAAVIYVATVNAYESDYVQSELEIAQAYRRTIYCVWAAGDIWVDCVPLGMIKAHYTDMRGTAYETNVKKLIEALGGVPTETAYTVAPPKPLPAGVEPRNPYKGLKAFEEKDTGDFFGRDELIATLVERVRDRARADCERLLAVIGASGSGKSSVVKAGLLPRLKRQHPDWQYLDTIVPGSRPVRALIRTLGKALPNKTVATIDEELWHPNGQGLRNLTELLTTETPVLLVIDQFEELFSSEVNDDERQQFINLVVTAVNESDCPLIAMLTLRADFYHHPMNYPALATLIGRHNESVLPMTLIELRRAIEEPARLPDAGLSFEGTLAGDLIFDLREDTHALAGALPLLQFTLEQLYERRDGTTLTLRAYQSIGGVRGAIGEHADAVFRKLDDAAQAALPQVFYALVNVDERGEATRKRALLTDLTTDPAAARLVDALVTERLLMTDRGEDEQAYVEVAHEALLRSWTRLANWIANAADDLRLLQRIYVEAEEWNSMGRPSFSLWSQEKLIPVYSMLSRFSVVLPEVVQDFIRPEFERMLEDFKGAPDYKQQTMVDRWIQLGVSSNIWLQALQCIEKGSSTVERIRRAFWDSIVRDITPFKVLTPHFESISKSSNYPLIKTITELGISEFIPYLINYSLNKDNDITLAALQGLALFNDPQFTPYFTNYITHSKRYIREAAIWALGQFNDPEFISTFADIAIGDKKHSVRAEAIRALGRYNLKELIPVFMEALKDGYPVVRSAAVRALSHLDDRNLIPVFMEITQKDKDYTRSLAVYALANYRDESLINIFKDLLSDPYDRVRRASILGLSRFQETGFITQFLDATGDNSKNVREITIEALRVFLDRNHTALFQRLTTDESLRVRVAATNALADYRDPTFLSEFRKVVHNESWSMKIAGIRGLILLGEEDQSLRLVDMLLDYNKSTRIEAAKVLGEVAVDQTLNAIIALIYHPFLAVRLSAFATLEVMNIPEARKAIENAISLGMKPRNQSDMRSLDVDEDNG